MPLLSVSISSVTLGPEGDGGIFAESFSFLRYFTPPQIAKNTRLFKSATDGRSLRSALEEATKDKAAEEQDRHRDRDD